MMTRADGALIGQRLGDYELRQVLGVGGMAEVYRGYDVVLQREVAVKVLAGSLAGERGYVERFRTEARRVAALHHPNVVPVYAAGEERGSLYLVMPILSDSLHDLLDRERRVPFAEAVALATQVASGLEAAHAIGLVHRDVKPENILMDADGKALLTDFGIAREMTPRGSGPAATLSATGLPVGTPEYMAPEQLRGEPLDARTDVYALGMVLYELLTGVLPFAGDTPYDVAVKVITATLPPPSAHDPSLPPELERAVLRALARDPAERFPSAAEFSMALRRAISHQGAAVAGAAGVPPARSAVAHADGAADPAPIPTAVTTAASTTENGARTADRTRRTRRMRRGIAGALAFLLLVGTVGGVLLTQRHSPPGGDTARTAHASPSTGATAATAATATAATATATAATPAAATATPAPGNPPGQATATPVPTQTTAPNGGDALGIAPQPFVLTPSAQDPKTCTATQTVTNTTSQTLGWRWQTSPIGGFHPFQVYSDTGAPIAQPGWPNPPNFYSLPPGRHDTLVASADCKSPAQSWGILATDSQGGQYTFVLTLQ